jgi:hypothetical protein
MLRDLRHASVLTLFLSIASIIGCGLFYQTPDAPEEPAEEPHAQFSEPRHEVFAPFPAALSSHVFSVLHPPPSPLPELPPEAKPEGDDVVWVPGYWAWDANRDDWVWVNGVWVHAPRGRRWMPGYWSVAADGWHWIHGFWAIDPPPPPSAQPLAVSSSPSAGWYEDPGLAFFTAFGMWWPWYQSRPLQANRLGVVSPPLLPSGHVASPTVSYHGPHAAEHFSFPVPPSASSVHMPLPPKPLTVPGVLPSPGSAPYVERHVDLASVFASVPKPLQSSLDPPSHLELPNEPSLPALHSALQGNGASGIPGVRNDQAGRMTSLFLSAHLETGLHDHLGFHGDSAFHSVEGERETENGSQESEGHGGGHGH